MSHTRNSMAARRARRWKIILQRRAWRRVDAARERRAEERAERWDNYRGVVRLTTRHTVESVRLSWVQRWWLWVSRLVKGALRWVR